MIGRVIDGPWEGLSYATTRPDDRHFRVAIRPNMHFPSEDLVNPITWISTEGVYVWSEPLRGWVFRWDLLPKAKSDGGS